LTKAKIQLDHGGKMGCRDFSSRQEHLCQLPTGTNTRSLVVFIIKVGAERAIASASLRRQSSDGIPAIKNHYSHQAS
jgi:hypothetical protein